MPPRRVVRAPVQLLVEGADAKFFFMAFLNHMGFNKIDVEVQSSEDWRGHSKVFRDAPGIVDSFGLRSKFDESELAIFSRVCGAILERFNPADIEIQDFGGNSQLRAEINAVWSAPQARSKIEAFGIIRDAETSAAAAFESVSKALGWVGLSVPHCPRQVVDGKPRVGVLILPPGKSEGMLEDICLEAMRCDPAMPCVEEYIKCVEENVPGWKDSNRKKAKVQAFLASRDEPGLKIGEAEKPDYWNWRHASYDPIRQFIHDLTAS